MNSLTGDVGAGGELGRHLGVHGDHDLLLLGHDGVPILDLFLDPLLEAGTDDGRAHVHDPLLRDLLDVGLVRQVVVDLRLRAGEGEDVLQAQAFVLWNMNILDLVVVDPALLAAGRPLMGNFY